MKKGYNLLVLKSLEYFVKNPYDRIYLREFSRKLEINVNSANRFLDLFVKEGFILEERVANLRYFKSNLNSIVFKGIKRNFCLREIEKSGILNNLKSLCFNFVLFGSCAKGVDDVYSDFDFVIISKKKKEVRNLFNKFENKFSREISLHIFSPLEWKKQKINNKAFYQDVVSTGINLIGEIPF